MTVESERQAVLPDEDSEQTLLLQIQALGQLPAPSQTALRLFALLQSEDTPLKDFVPVVKGDPTLAARVMRLANRPGNGALRPAVAVEEALVRLGLNAVAQLAVGLSVLDEGMTDHAVEVPEYLRLCRLSLAAGVAAEWLSGQPGIPAAAAEMFTCALLARVGQLAMLRFYPEAYSGFLGMSGDPQEQLGQERESFGVDYLAVGAALLADWGFPAILIEAIGLAGSDQAELAESERQEIMVRILHAAWALAGPLASGNEASLASTMRQALALLGMEATETLQAVDDLQRRWALWHQDGESRPTPGVGGKADGLDYGQQRPITVALLLNDSLLDPTRRQALVAAGYLVTETTSLLQTCQAIMSGQADVGIAAATFSDCQAHAPLLAAYLGDLGRGALLLSDDLDEEAKAAVLSHGIEAVLPLAVGAPLLVAEVNLIARRIALHRLLETERISHRRSLSELAVTTRKLHRQSLTDPLTGLANRRMADAFLKRHWSQAERRNFPLSCLLIDLDDFKRINDTYGHDAGDRVLHGFAEILKRQVRQEDLAVRLGGDEFLVICPHTCVTEAQNLLGRLRVTAQKVRLETGSLEFSAGVVERDAKTMGSPADLLRAADRKMMQVKRGGKR